MLCEEITSFWPVCRDVFVVLFRNSYSESPISSHPQGWHLVALGSLPGRPCIYRHPEYLVHSWEYSRSHFRRDLSEETKTLTKYVKFTIFAYSAGDIFSELDAASPPSDVRRRPSAHTLTSEFVKTTYRNRVFSPDQFNIQRSNWNKNIEFPWRFMYLSLCVLLQWKVEFWLLFFLYGKKKGRESGRKIKWQLFATTFFVLAIYYSFQDCSVPTGKLEATRQGQRINEKETL